MKMPFQLPFFGKKEKQEYFLALLLRDERVTAVVFEEFLGKIRLVGESEESLTNSIEQLSLEELVETLDKIISLAEENLPENVQTQKTIFGLKENWVEEQKIKKEYLLKLKKISELLSLQPVGFLIIHEAIAHLLQQEEGAPVSAILVEVAKENLIISLLRAGRIVETKKAAIQNSIAETTDKTLHHFVNYEVLPSRIIVFNDKDDEKITQELLAHSWSKSLPFLHVPQTTMLPEDFAAKAVVSGAATQMGFEILEEKKEISKEEKLTEFQKDEREILKAQRGELLEIKEMNEVFGFLTEEDIVKKSEEENKEAKKASIETEEVKTRESEEEEEIPKEEEVEAPERKINFLERLSWLKNVSKKLTFFNNFSLKLDDFEGKIIFVPPLLVGFLILLILAYLFFVKATVVINVKPKVIEQKQKIIFSTTVKTNLDQKIIGSETVTITKEGTTSTIATGKKEIGEKAKGTVVLYNSSLSESRNLLKGTVVTSSNGLPFTLDDSVKVASATGDPSAITSSTAKAAVTAKEIGKEANLPSGTKFTIEGLSSSSMIAKNEVAFSGGTKKEVTVVAKTDVAKLLEDLPKNLENKAKEELSKKTTEEKIILPFFLKSAVEKKKFDKEVGEETKTVTLRGSVVYQGWLYPKNEFKKLTHSLLQKDFVQDLILKGEVEDQILEINKKSDKEVEALVKLRASLVPKIDEEKLTIALSGKTFETAEETIRKLPQISQVEISLHPGFPFLPKLLPRLSQNIKIVIEANE